jgi:Aldo/keto reductase family
VVSRKELFVTSKLWNSNHSPEHVRPAIENSLKALGLDYLDLYLMHFPVANKYIDPAVCYPPGIPSPEEDGKQEPILVTDTWKALEEVFDAGLAHNIGVSNFSAGNLWEILKVARIKVSHFRTLSFAHEMWHCCSAMRFFIQPPSPIHSLTHCHCHCFLMYVCLSYSAACCQSNRTSSIPAASSPSQILPKPRYSCDCICKLLTTNTMSTLFRMHLMYSH